MLKYVLNLYCGEVWWWNQWNICLIHVWWCFLHSYQSKKERLHEWFYMFFHRWLEVQQTKRSHKKYERESLSHLISFNVLQVFHYFFQVLKSFQHFDLTFESSTEPMTDRDGDLHLKHLLQVMSSRCSRCLGDPAHGDLRGWGCQGTGRTIREMDHFFGMISCLWNHIDVIYIHIHI